MLLPTELPNRRQFLERSMLGFGSAFLLPSLLTGCTDHIIPDPGPGDPVVLPPLGDDQIDWNDDARIVVSTALGLVPGFGEILGPLTDILWPKGSSTPWDQVKDAVKGLVNDEITTEEYNTALDALGQVDDNNVASGLVYYITAYHNALNNPKVEDKYPSWYDATGQFANQIDVFKATHTGHSVAMLPVFAQFANLHLALLREGLTLGQNWTGMSAGNYSQLVTDLPTLIQDYTTHATKTYSSGLTDIVNRVPNDDANVEPFRTSNIYARQMTLTVLDYMDSWIYYDPSQYPNGAVNPDGTALELFNREVYWEPVGNTYFSAGTNGSGSHPIMIYKPATKRPTTILVYSGTRINAVEVKYDNGGGPGDLETTGRMGSQTGGITNEITVPDNNPIVQAYVSWSYGDTSDEVINTLNFKCDQSYPTIDNVMMGKGGKEETSIGPLGYPNMALSSIYIQGVSVSDNNTANCIVFGWLFWKSRKVLMKAISDIYVKSPKERSAADFAKAFPKLGLSEASITAELKAARKTYWEKFQARVKKPK